MRRSHKLVEYRGDLLGRVAIPERLRLRAGWVELLDRVEDVRGLRPYEGVPTVLHGLDPLGLVAEGDARHAEEIRFLLHPAAVRDDLRRAHQERDEIEVVDRLDRLHLRAQRLPQAERLEVLPRARMDREDDGPARSDQRVNDAFEGLAVVHARGPMQRHEDVLAFLDAEALGDVPRASRLGTLQRDVVHHVADEVYAVGDALVGEGVDRRLRRAEQERG